MGRRTLFARWASVATAVVTCCASAVGAQTVSGIVVDRNDRPVAGAVVLLVDSTTMVTARVLTSATGAFRLSAPQPGAYRLRTLRIGYRPELTDVVRLARGPDVEQRIVLAGVQISLDTVRVVDRSMCGSRSDSALAVFAVWEQARTALNATQLGPGAGVVEATTVLYERTLGPDARTVLTQTASVRSGFVTRAWLSASPDALHRDGYVVTNRDNTTTYYAPGLDVLLSPVFVADHCFRLAGGRGAPAGSIGVAFEPTRDRRGIPEIRGTLWLDRRTAQLRELQFKFTNVLREQEDNAGGEMAFGVLGTGAWAVTRWNIRMPVLEQVVRSQDLGGTHLRVAEMRVAGGELALVTTAAAGRSGRDTVWSQPAMRVAGVVADSVTGDPVSGARVAVTGTEVVATTDDRGRFTLAGILPGEYQIDVTTPSLRAIGASSRHSATFADASGTLDLRVPTAAQFAAALCGTAGLITGTGVVIGRVRTRDDTTQPGGGSVVAEWSEISVHDEHGVTAATQRRRAEARAASDGGYRLCGVPLNTELSLRAEAAGVSSAKSATRLGEGRVAHVDLTLDRAVERGARLSGAVLDSAGAPLAGVEVAIPDLSKRALTDPRGRFELTGISAGEHHVIARRIGYGIADVAVPFGDDGSIERTFVLPRVSTLDSVVVQADRSDPMMRDFEDDRRLGLGHFLTRDQLERLRGQTFTRALQDLPGITLARGGVSHAWVLSKRAHASLCPPVRPGVRSQCYDANGIYNPSEAEALRGIGAGCYVAVFLDDTQLNPGRPTPPFDASTIAVDQIEAVEYFEGVSELPVRYSGWNSDCGVLVIHTRRP
jgi:hypothetical protein